MTVKNISKIVKICSLIVFPKCFEVKFCLIFAEIFPEQIFAVLIIPKLLSKPALTIVNAPLTLCAARNAALTSFAFLLASSQAQFAVAVPCQTLVVGEVCGRGLIGWG